MANPSHSKTIHFGPAACLACLPLTLTLAPACHPNSPAAPVAITSGPAAAAPDGVRYCGATPSLWTTFECVGEVNADLARRRARIVRATFQGGKLVSEELVNGHGAPVDGADWSANRYEHDAAGRPIGEVMFDAFGVERRRLRFTADGTRALRTNAWGEPTGGPSDEDNDWTVAVHERDAKHRRTSSRYFDEAGQRRSVWRGASEMRFRDYVNQVNAKHETFFDASGSPTDDRGGVHHYLCEVGAWSVASCRFLGREGTPARSFGRWGWRNQFDAVGNVLWSEDLDVSGNPFHTADGPARRVFTRDAHGDAIEERLFFANGSPDERSAALVRRVFDDRGHPVVTTYLDAEGRPSVKSNYARMESSYDPAGAVVEHRFFRADGSPGNGKPGPRLARTQRVYDDRHNLVELRFVAADGSAGNDVYGVTVVRNRYHHDRLVEVERRGPKGERFGLRGVAHVAYQRERDGRIVATTFHDASGAPVQAFDYLSYYVGFAGSARDTGAKRTREEARAQAEKILAAAKPGQSFMQAGALYADNPDERVTREMAAPELYPEVAQALSATAVNGLTGIIESPAGFSVVRRDR